MTVPNKLDGAMMTEQDQFEHAMEDSPHYWHRMLWLEADGEYREAIARAAWVAWQARAALAAAPAQSGEPVAYMYTMHMEGSQTQVRFEHSLCNPFGVAGEDYDESYRVTCERLYAAPQPAQNAPPDAAEFKNFHRLLCERFDYTHDDKDWKRDQLSLIEWIAAAPQPAQSERALTGSLRCALPSSLSGKCPYFEQPEIEGDHD